MSDPVEHPAHYTSHKSGVECITITEHMGFCLGNAVKYIWRADLKGGLEDLRKARWYIDREIARREKAYDARRAAEQRGPTWLDRLNSDYGAVRGEDGDTIPPRAKSRAAEQGKT